MIDTVVVHSILKNMEDAKALLNGQEQTGLTISAIRGNKIFTNEAIDAIDGDWEFGVLEVTTSSSAKFLREVVTSAVGTEISLARPFPDVIQPAVGDTVRLYGGPLSEATFYLGEPDGLSVAIEEGVRHFVIVSVEEGDMSVKGLRGRRVGSEMVNTEIVYGMQVSVETPRTVGAQTEAEYVRAIYDHPTLRGQVLTLLHDVRFDAGSRTMGVGPISWGNVMLERASKHLLDASIIVFELSLV